MSDAITIDLGPCGDGYRLSVTACRGSLSWAWTLGSPVIVTSRNHATLADALANVRMYGGGAVTLEAHAMYCVDAVQRARSVAATLRAGVQLDDALALDRAAAHLTAEGRRLARLVSEGS